MASQSKGNGSAALIDNEVNSSVNNNEDDHDDDDKIFGNKT